MIRAEDPRVEFSGIVAGMSGSPVYIDGKLMGAVAYAWSFAKEPLGGVTPIESMLAERSRPRRVKEEMLASGGGGDRAATAPAEAVAAVSDFERAESAAGGGDRPAALARGLGLPTLFPSGGAGGGEPRLVRASVPLSVAGFTPRTFSELESELRPTGLVALQAGGGRKRESPPAPGHVEPGSAIGVELVRGDMSTVATGTVTYIDGPNVFAFGHPMFGIGEVYLPMVDAEIHAFLPSLSQSFKMSSPLQEVGTLVQDRQACIIGDLDARTTMMPVEVRVGGPGGEARIFHADVARNRRLTPMLASMVVSNAIADAEPDVTDMVVTVTSKMNVKGFTTLELRDQLFSSEGVSGRTLSSSRGLRAMGELLFNPFEPVVLDRMDVDVRVEFRRDVAEIVGVSMPGDVVHAGDTVPLRVTLRPYAGSEYVEIVPVVIPRSVGGDMVKLEVASGAQVKPDTPQARVAARLHREPAQVLLGVVDRRQRANARRRRGAAREAAFGPAAGGAGYVAPGQPDPARRCVSRRRSHRVSVEAVGQRQARADAVRARRRARPQLSVILGATPKRANLPGLAYNCPAHDPDRSTDAQRGDCRAAGGGSGRQRERRGDQGFSSDQRQGLRGG